MGYAPARDLLARNYPQSEAVRSVVPATDVIRYALGPVMDVAATSEDSKQIFLAVGQHFALQGQLFCHSDPWFTARRLASAARLSDRHLAGLAGARPRSLRRARLIPGEGEAADRECSFSQNLRKHIETTAPAREEEEESKRRGLFMLKQVGGR